MALPAADAPEGCTAAPGATSTGEPPRALADVAAGFFPGVWRFEGFISTRLNTDFLLNKNINIGGQPSYWDKAGRLFLYYQEAEQRWAICPLVDDGEVLLAVVQHGVLRGIAFEGESFGEWHEYIEAGSEYSEGWLRRELHLTQLPEPEPWQRPRPSDPLCPPVTPSTAAPSSGRGAQPTVQEILADHPELQEVLATSGPRGAKLILRFDAASDAGAAMALKQKLMAGCKARAVRIIAANEFGARRAQLEQRKRQLAAQAAAPAVVGADAGAGAEPDAKRPKPSTGPAMP